ncbi:hypothetical protein PENTCL1PPCAC_17005, partial [Pristionchus entomophagus]
LRKVQLLSLVTDIGQTMNKTILCVPSASLHYPNLAKNYNMGGVDFDVKYQRERFDEDKSNRFTEFICRSNVLISLPWGDTRTT